MKGTLFFSAVLAACGAPAPEPIEGNLASVLERGIREGKETFDHSAWDEILSSYAREDGRRFDYAGLKQDEKKLDAYLDALSRVGLEQLSAAEIEALFINAYNAYTVRTVLDRVSDDGAFTIESIRDIENVFTRESHRVGGFTLSLDNIEHNVLRPTFRDPRLHFAVNCASISCPPLPVDAFEGERIEEQLEAAAKNALRDPEYASVEDETLVLSKIFEWYGEDFGDVRAFVARYADERVRLWIEEQGDDVEIRFRDYDWRLNRP